MNRKKKEELKKKHFGVMKSGKYLVSHGYATGLGYKFLWSKNKNEARRMPVEQAEMFSGHGMANGKLVDLDAK